MKQTLLVSICLNEFPPDVGAERYARSTWDTLRRSLADAGSRCDRDEGNQERRACFLIDRFEFTRLLTALPPLPAEIILTVYTLAQQSEQFIEQEADAESLEPTNYMLRWERRPARR